MKIDTPGLNFSRMGLILNQIALPFLKQPALQKD